MTVDTERAGVRVLRGLSGVLAGGLVALAITVCVAQWLASTSGRPGLGMATVACHVLAALSAVVLQLAAEWAPRRGAALASWAVLVLAAVILWFGWWA
ncbi:MAG: hypothetical protein JO272_04795 [Pseudonocardiales bacterium]|nr:hypothetical protein [Pseudonocardiales bacterium]